VLCVAERRAITVHSPADMVEVRVGTDGDLNEGDLDTEDGEMAGISCVVTPRSYIDESSVVRVLHQQHVASTLISADHETPVWTIHRSHRRYRYRMAERMEGNSTCNLEAQSSWWHEKALHWPPPVDLDFTSIMFERDAVKLPERDTGGGEYQRLRAPCLGHLSPVS